MKYVQGLPDYYHILQIPSTASQSQIKHAFRKRAKKFHPDTARTDSASSMQDLVLAYETLISKERRAHYDIQYKLVSPQTSFNYRHFLYMRKDNPVYAAKLIFYDLLHDREEAAAQLYLSMDKFQNKHEDVLVSNMERDDFMDCAFLLAEYFERIKNFKDAASLLHIIIRHEKCEPYFKHFFPVVLNAYKRVAKVP